MKSQTSSYGVHHLVAQKTGDLSQLLHSEIGLEQSRTQELLDLGAIYKNHIRINPQDRDIPLQKSDYIRVHSQPRRYFINYQWEQTILFENDQFLLVNKPSGIPSHPCVDNKKENLLFALQHHLQYPIFITHRLDIPTSGLIILAKNKKFQKDFNQILSEGHLKKIYLAQITEHYEGPLLLEHYMLPTSTAPKKLVDQYEPGAFLCRMNILNSTQNSLGSILEIDLQTGRTQQIRAQLAHMGYPILGDTLYGGKPLELINQIGLRCVALQFHYHNQCYSWDFRTVPNSLEFPHS